MSEIKIARVIEGEEEAEIIAGIRARLPDLPKVGDLSRWERGWSENWEAYRKSGDPADLRPKYIRQKQPMRYHGRFVWPEDDDAEMKWYEDFREEIFTFFFECQAIFEFGSGSGHNLAYLRKRYPSTVIVGLDWSWAAVQIAKSIDIGKRFDFYNPTIANFHPGSGVLTVGALEQTGGERWMPFMEELLIARPEICVHIEPILELYDPNNPVDLTAIEVHKAKGFWEGFWPWCKARRREGKIEILEANRTGVGSLMIEGYSVIIWRPL